MWYSSGTLSKQFLSCVQFREMEVLREVMRVMTGGLGMAANGNKKMYHYIENACIRALLVCNLYIQH